MARILIVDDDSFFLMLIERLLAKNGHKVFPAKGGDQALRMLETESFDLMISDINMEPVNGMELLRNSRSRYPDLEVIMLTSHSTIEIATDAMTKGAFDYITKPLDVNALSLTVRHALDHSAVRAENKRLRSEMEHLSSLEGFVAQSGSMCNICNTIVRAAPSDINLLLCGEDGTSKDRIARTLHRAGPRKEKSFQIVNCEQLSSQQMELDLFGYVRGAFKWADTSKDGLLETMYGGTLFLDEITFMPPDIQSRILEMLQNKKICKVGGSDPINVDVRIIAASSREFEPLIERGVFCENLYRELCALRIDIPPLRDRPEDILPLADQILREKSGRQRGVMDLDMETETILNLYSWPCNERELEGAIHYARSVAKNRVITKGTLPAQIVIATEESIRAHKAPGSTGQFKGHFFRAFLYDKEKDRLRQVETGLEEQKQSSSRGRQGGSQSDIKWLN